MIVSFKFVNKVRILMPVILLAIFSQTGNAQGKHSNMGKMSNSNFKSLDTTAIAQIMGMKGKSNNGEYKITIPQNDLDVKVDGFKIIPAMGLGAWIAFTPSKEGMIMGDLIVTETDLKPCTTGNYQAGVDKYCHS
jgi:hypothetical protein